MTENLVSVGRYWKPTIGQRVRFIARATVHDLDGAQVGIRFDDGETDWRRADELGPCSETAGPDFDAIARKHLTRYGSGSWIDREAPILAERLREAFDAGRAVSDPYRTPQPPPPYPPEPDPLLPTEPVDCPEQRSVDMANWFCGAVFIRCADEAEVVCALPPHGPERAHHWEAP